MENILLGFLSKTLNMDTEAVTELLYTKDGEELKVKEGALDSLLVLDQKRVERLKGGNTEKIAKDQYKRGVKEAMETLEKQLREEYGLETEANGVDLVRELVKAKTAEVASLKDDDVKKHPSYLDLENRLKKEVQGLTQKFEQEKSQIEGQFKRAATLSTVQKTALSALEKYNPITPSNPTIAANLRNLFLKEFEQFDYQETDGGYLVIKDEKRVEDGHGNPVTFDSMVGDLASRYFEFKKQDAKGNGANANEGGGVGGSGQKVASPKSEEDFYRMSFEAKDATERQAIKEAWEASKGTV